MSRTYKDQPYLVKVARIKRKKLSGDWRYRGPGWWNNNDEFILTDGEWYLINWCRDGVVGRYAKEANREYRAKCRQLMREGRYDDICRPRKHAQWDAW